MVQNRKLIAIGRPTAQKLEDAKKLEKSSLSFAEYVDNYLQSNLDRDTFLRTYFDGISTIGITDNVLFLKDSTENDVIEIKLIDGQLVSNNENPRHIQYAVGCTEICKLM